MASSFLFLVLVTEFLVTFGFVFFIPWLIGGVGWLVVRFWLTLSFLGGVFVVPGANIWVNLSIIELESFFLSLMLQGGGWAGGWVTGLLDIELGGGWTGGCAVGWIWVSILLATELTGSVVFDLGGGGGRFIGGWVVVFSNLLFISSNPPKVVGIGGGWTGGLVGWL